MSYSDDMFKKAVIRELSRIATALENIDMKMTDKNSFKPEVASYIKDEPLKTRTVTDCVGCEHLFVTHDISSNEKRYRCTHYNKYINEITNCNLR